MISLLQYMKKTNLDNPEVLVQDERILKLDSIVNEVKESEEWEAVSMNIYSVAHERGFAQGEAIGKEIGKDTKLIELVCKKMRRGKTVAAISDELEEEVEWIQQICEMASAFAPEYDSDRVVETWLREKDKEKRKN